MFWFLRKLQTATDLGLKGTVECYPHIACLFKKYSRLSPEDGGLEFPEFWAEAHNDVQMLHMCIDQGQFDHLASLVYDCWVVAGEEKYANKCWNFLMVRYFFWFVRAVGWQKSSIKHRLKRC